MVTVLLGVTQAAGQLADVRTRDHAAQPPATSAPATQPSVAPARLPLLSLLFTTRLSAALPGIDLVRGGGSALILAGGSAFGNEGDYQVIGAQAVVDPSPAIGDVIRLSVGVYEPLTNAPLPTVGIFGALYGDCAAVWRGGTTPAGSSDCDQRAGPGGSTIVYGWRDQQVARELIAVMAFPDGVAVRVEAYGKPETVAVTASILADVVADPRYVIPAWGPRAELAATPAPTADWGADMVECLAPKGWDVRRASDGYESSVAPERYDQYEVDVATCQAQLSYGELVTPAVAGRWYEQTAAGAGCLRGHGYAISEPPSREAFVEQLLAKRLPEWDPYAEVFTTGGPSGVREAQATCPPPTSW